jgi:hypothetical protein
MPAERQTGKPIDTILGMTFGASDVAWALRIPAWLASFFEVLHVIAFDL